MGILKNAVSIIGKYLFNNKNSKVVYYHDIHSEYKYTYMSTPLDLFKEHVKLIKERGYSITNDISQKKNEIEICFDDGFMGIYENKEFLIKNKVEVKLFIITDFINTPNYLSSNQILELNATGLFKFGCHTHTHVNLGSLNAIAIEKELTTNKQILESLLNEKIFDFCFPRGSFSDLSIKIAKATGFTNLYSSIPGSYYHKEEKDVIYRNIAQSDTIKQFDSTLKGAQQIFKRRRFKQHFET